MFFAQFVIVARVLFSLFLSELLFFSGDRVGHLLELTDLEFQLLIPVAKFRELALEGTFL